MKTKRDGENGLIIYESGETAQGNFTKSSRFVYIKSHDKYGEISQIYKDSSNNIWFCINLFMTYAIDCETNLPRSQRNISRTKIILKEDDLSDPLIVGVDDVFVWFLSIDHDSCFSWLDEHLKSCQ